MIAAVCDTPYQIMSAIAVANEVAPGEEIVFFINRYLYFRDQDFSYCDDHPCIHKILYYARKHMSPALLLRGLFRADRMLCSIEGYDPAMRFSAIITARTTYMATYLYRKQAQEQLPVYLVEEGIGEYTGNMIDTRFTKALKTLRQKTHMDHVTCAYFSAPELYPFEPPFPVRPLPKMQGVVREMIESMFVLGALRQVNALNAFHCIFLSEPTTSEMTDEHDIAEYDGMESRIMDIAIEATRGDIIEKTHPVGMDFEKDGIEKYRTKLPMECLLFTLNCKDKIFISSASTAMLTPKLLFDEEPFLVFTHKILDPYLKKLLKSDALRAKYYAVIDGVLSKVRDQGRVAVPETVEEYEAVLRDFYARACGGGQA